jgi:hypothetical protein
MGKSLDAGRQRGFLSCVSSAADEWFLRDNPYEILAQWSNIECSVHPETPGGGFAGRALTFGLRG